MSPNILPRLLQSFFTDRLLAQRRASPNTVAGYRDSFRLLLAFAATRSGKAASELSLEDISAPVIGGFLDHIESERGNTPRTRNARLAAFRAFFRWVAASEPAHALLCQRVLAIPSKRCDRAPVAYVEQAEAAALVAAPDLSTWTGRRDRTLLLLALQTGLRVSELRALCWENVSLGVGAHVRCMGKGRKQRCTPLRKDAIAALRSWQRETHGALQTPVFSTAQGRVLSRDAVERLVTKHAETARRRCPSLGSKNVSPHTLRHSAAMDLLHHGVDPTIIALWLGHESVETTQIYLHADMRLKEQAMARTAPLGTKPGRFRPSDDLLAFLEGL
jgi:site-specific recombinase XerD